MDFSNQGRHPPSQLAAMAAHTHNVNDNEPWFANSGANNHITTALDKLALQQPYQDGETVIVGNCGGLQISNTGSTLIQTPTSTLHLNNVLHCPSASTNLLSIQQFCADNNCYFQLTSSRFLVKDMQIGEIMLQGPSKAGLYPFY